ncbi:MAG: ROK family protein [Pirellulaceae bacterium]
MANDKKTEKRNYWLGFDLGGSKMLAVVFDSDFKACGRHRKKTKGLEGQASVMSRVVSTILGAIEDAEVDISQISGLGIGMPGPVDEDEGVVLEAVNLAWKNVRLADLLKEELGLPVVVLNDVDSGVYAEYRFGAAKSARTALGVFPGTGIGGGCVYDGEIVHGRGISCMEIGHIQVQENGRLCGCGQRGCLEAEASRLAISAELAMAAYRGETPHLLAETGTDVAKMRSGALARAVKAGDKVVENILRSAAARIGVAVANVVLLVAPDVVVLGGGLVEEMPDLFVREVTKSANARVMSSFVGSFEVVVAKLGDDASVLGAAAWAQKVVSEAGTGS